MEKFDMEPIVSLMDSAITRLNEIKKSESNMQTDFCPDCGCDVMAEWRKNEEEKSDDLICLECGCCIEFNEWEE